MNPIAAIIHATDKDLDFLESKNLALREEVYKMEEHCFAEYDEVLEKS